MDILHENLHKFYDFWLRTLPWLPVFLGYYSYTYKPEASCCVDISYLAIVSF
jgi:hypothetical protein